MKNITRVNNLQFTRWNLLLLVCTCFFSSVVQSEVTLDGSVGPAGALTGPNYKITENLGKRAGSNLFHSFGRLNLNASESATFSGSSGIKNVISRVTGGQASNIDGTLRVSIPNANLYLLNPAGVIFGEHAKLDVPGSFRVSTADYLKFQDGVRFDSGTAIAPQVLATAKPEAFGFLGENPAGISLSGTTGSVLGVKKGSTISLIGGDITSENTAIYTPGGQINIASVGSAGEVSFNESGIQITSFGQMGDIRLSQNPFVPRTTLGAGLTLANIETSDDTAGKIFIRGGQMVMDNSFVVSDTTNGNGGNISIGLTGDLSLSSPPKSSNIGLFTGSSIATNTIGEGKAGDITINAKAIKLQGDDPDVVTSASFGHGDTGNIAITTDTLEVRGESLIGIITLNKGEGGDLIINAENLKVTHGGKIANITGSESIGKGGNLSINANNILLSGVRNTGIATVVQGRGNGGELTITSNKLEVKNGARILSGLSAKGNGGNLFVESNEIILTNH